MFAFLLGFDFMQSSGHPVNETIRRIKMGDEAAKNQFIAQYKPFIIKSVSGILANPHIEIENSDEFSIGLIAFNEALDCYDETKNRNFFEFARQVIKRRIINYWQSNQKGSPEYTFSYLQNDNPDHLDHILPSTENFTREYEIKEEILNFKDRLAEFGIPLKELVSNTPKHRDSKILSIQIAETIAGNENLYRQMMKRKTLPMVELLKISKFNKRTLERHRKYIIAICLILRSELEILKDYILSAKGGA